MDPRDEKGPIEGGALPGSVAALQKDGELQRGWLQDVPGEIRSQVHPEELKISMPHI